VKCFHGVVETQVRQGFSQEPDDRAVIARFEGTANIERVERASDAVIGSIECRQRLRAQEQNAGAVGCVRRGVTRLDAIDQAGRLGRSAEARERIVPL